MSLPRWLELALLSSSALAPSCDAGRSAAGASGTVVIAGAAEAPVSAVALLGMICNSTGVMGLSFGIDAGYTNGWGLNG